MIMRGRGDRRDTETGLASLRYQIDPDEEDYGTDYFHYTYFEVCRCGSASFTNEE